MVHTKQQKKVPGADAGTLAATQAHRAPPQYAAPSAAPTTAAGTASGGALAAAAADGRRDAEILNEVALNAAERAHHSGSGADSASPLGADFASPFEDELDTPAFLRRRASES